MTTSHGEVTHQSVYNIPFEQYGEGTWSFQGHPQRLCGPSRLGGAEEETKMHFASLWVTMTTSHCEVDHQSE